MTSPLVLSLGRAANKLLHVIGLQVSRFPGPAERRRWALMRGAQIDALLDIGANTGQYAEAMRACGFAGKIVSCEPIPAAVAELRRKASRDPAWEIIDRAVTDSPEPAVFRVSENLVSSSLLPMADRHVDAAPSSRTVREIVVQTITLDAALSALATHNVMVKIDAQGAERSVLASGIDRLRSVRLIELEMSLVELYEGQAQMRELDAFLIGHGFSLVSLAEGFFNERTGELLQVDAIYRRSAA